MIMKKWFVISVMLLICSLLNAKVLDPEAPMGSRKNPVPIRTTIQTEILEDGQRMAIADLAINGVMRGTLAKIYLLALQVAEGDEVPSIQNDDREYMLVVLSVDNIEDLTGNDEAFHVGHEEVMLANKNFVARNPSRIAHIQDELEGYMYEGSTHAGFLLYEVNDNEEYYLVYQDKWFDLGTDTDEVTMNAIMNM